MSQDWTTGFETTFWYYDSVRSLKAGGAAWFAILPGGAAPTL